MSVAETRKYELRSSPKLPQKHPADRRRELGTGDTLEPWELQWGCKARSDK